MSRDRAHTAKQLIDTVDEVLCLYKKYGHEWVKDPESGTLVEFPLMPVPEEILQRAQNLDARIYEMAEQLDIKLPLPPLESRYQDYQYLGGAGVGVFIQDHPGHPYRGLKLTPQVKRRMDWLKTLAERMATTADAGAGSWQTASEREPATTFGSPTLGRIYEEALLRRQGHQALQQKPCPEPDPDSGGFPRGRLARMHTGPTFQTRLSES